MKLTETVQKIIVFSNMWTSGKLFECAFATRTAQLPRHLRAHPVLMFQYGQNLPVPIKDLELSELGVSATLSFDGKPHHTFVPWEAIKVLRGNGRQAVWDAGAPSPVDEEEKPTSPPPKGENVVSLADFRKKTPPRGGLH